MGATGACLAGTFARALKARGIELHGEDHEVDVEGRIVTDRGIMMADRTVVRHRVRLSPADQAEATKVLGIYHRGCPVSRSLGGAIEIQSQLDFANPSP